jgi:Na+/melibiose symporter-like transporter
MKALLIGFQSLGLVLAIFLMWFYPISRKRAEETQRLLEEKASSSSD